MYYTSLFVRQFQKFFKKLLHLFLIADNPALCESIHGIIMPSSREILSVLFIILFFPVVIRTSVP